MSIEFLGECVNIFFIVNGVPDKAAVIVKVDGTYFWTVEKFLGDFVEESFPADEDGNISFVVCLIFYFGIFNGDKIEIVLSIFCFAIGSPFNLVCKNIKCVLIEVLRNSK